MRTYLRQNVYWEDGRMPWWIKCTRQKSFTTHRNRCGGRQYVFATGSEAPSAFSPKSPYIQSGNDLGKDAYQNICRSPDGYHGLKPEKKWAKGKYGVLIWYIYDVFSSSCKYQIKRHQAFFNSVASISILKSSKRWTFTEWIKGEMGRAEKCKFR